MRDQNGRQGPNKVEREGRQKYVDDPPRSQQGTEPRCHHHGRQHEGNNGQGTQKGFAGEIITGKEIGGRQTKQKRKQCGKRRLVEGERKDPACQLKIFAGQCAAVKGKRKDTGKRVEKSDT